VWAEDGFVILCEVCSEKKEYLYISDRMNLLYH